MNHNNMEDEEDDQDINEEQIVQVILELGNQILGNLGVEEHIDDVGVFFSDAFYIQFFEAAFPDQGFNQMREATNEQEMAENIQALIDHLGSEILKYDLSHISGEEIVSGNPEHCINLLQLVQEISVMLDNQEEGGEGLQIENEDQSEGDEDEAAEAEDEEAQIIYEKKQRELQMQQQQQQRQQQQQQQQKSGSKQQDVTHSSQKQGRFQKDNFDVDSEEEDDEDEAEMKEQLKKMNMKDNYHEEQRNMQDDDDDENEEDDEGEEFDEDELKMYEQFIANTQQEQKQLAMGGKGQGMPPPPPNAVDADDDDDEDSDPRQQRFSNNKKGGSGPGQESEQQYEHGDDEDEEEDVGEGDDEDDDLADLDPEFIMAAREMGLQNAQIRQLQKQIQSQGYGEEDDEGDEDEQSFYSEGEIKTRIKLLKQKSYSTPYILFSDCYEEPLCDTESQVLQKAYSTTMLQSLELKEPSGDEDDDEGQGEDMDEETAQLIMQQQQQQQMMLMQQQQQQQKQKSQENSNGKPQKQQVQPQKANSASNSKQQPVQAQQQFYQDEDDEDEDDEEMDIDMAQQLKQLQQQQQQQQTQNQQQQQLQQQQQKQFQHQQESDEMANDEYDDEDEEIQQQLLQQQLHQQQMQQQQQQQQHTQSSSKKQHQQQQQQLQQQQQDQDDDEEEGGEGEGEDEEDDDGDMMNELDNLDENSKQMLLQYLQQEYEKDPSQIPIPKHILEAYLLQQQDSKQEDTIRDIRSDEMIVEDVNQQDEDVGQIEGGEQDIEQEDGGDDGQYDEDELTEEQQQQLHQMLLMQQQQKQQQQQQDNDYGEEDDENAQHNQMLLQQQQQQQMMNQQMGAGKIKKKKTLKKKGTSSRTQSVGKKKQNRQQQYMDNENVDPNVLQQMIMAQSQQQLLQQQQQQQMQGYYPQPQNMMPGYPQQRRASAGKKKVQPKKLAGISSSGMMKNVKSMQPNTPGSGVGGSQYKSFNTQRSGGAYAKKKTRKSASKRKIAPAMGDVGSPLDNMPVLSEEYLNQLNEDELQQLLEQQQEQMMMQQQNQYQAQQQRSSGGIKSLRPKSAKRVISPAKKSGFIPVNTKPKTSSYVQQYPTYGILKKKTSKGAKKKKKKTTMGGLTQQQQYHLLQQQIALQGGGYPQNQGVFLNNYFPALEGTGPNGAMGGDGSQMTDEGGNSLIQHSKDSRYPKYSNENINNPNYMGSGVPGQDPIDEVPPEQEEGESQENIQHRLHQHQFHPQHLAQHHHQQQDQDDPNMGGQQYQDEGEGVYEDDEGEEINENGEENMELTEEQLFQLIQNAHNLTPEQQLQLQMFLKDRMKGDIMNDRAQSYQNIYEILMDNVQKAKQRLAPLGEAANRIDAEGDTDRRILKQKLEFDTLLKQYLMETKAKEMKRAQMEVKTDKHQVRQQKIQHINDKKFEQDLVNQQKSLMYKRNAQQVRLCQKVYKLASELEKNKLLAEKREFRENQERKKAQKKMMVDAIETYYKNRINLLKERIGNERFERQIAQQAQQQALSRMKRELNVSKKKEVERYMQLLKQEDERYDFESTNMGKLENEIVKLYKKQ